MALTPEEQQELELLQAELEPPKKELAPDEKDELDLLKAELSPEEIDVALAKEGFQIEQPESELKDKIGSMALGMAQAATFNNLDEAIAGTGAVLDTLNDPDKTWSEFSSTYGQKKEEVRQALTLSEQENPIAHGAGEFIGTVGTAVIPGGLGARIAGNTLKSAIAVGSLRGVGSAKNLKLDEEIAKDIASEIGTEVLGFGAGKVLQKAAKSGRAAIQGKKVVQETEFARQRTNALLDTLGVQGKANFKKFQRDVVAGRGLTEEQVMTDLLEDLDIQAGMNPGEIKKLMKEKQDVLWDLGITPIFDDVDKVMPQGSIPTMELRDTLLADLGLADQFIDKTPEQVENIVKKLVPEIAIETENNVSMRLIDAQDLLKRLNRLTGNRDTRRILDRSIRKVMTKNVSKNLDPVRAREFMTLKRKYGNIAESHAFITDADALYKDAIRKFDESTASMWTRIATLGDLVKPGSPGKTVERFASVLKNKAPLDYTPSTRLAALNAVADSILENPGKYDNLVQRVAIGATRSVDEFVETMGVLEAHVALDQQPLTKDIGSVMLNKDNIYNVLKAKNPNLAKQFIKAVNDQNVEQIGTMISTISLLPEAQRFFADNAPGFTDEMGVRRLYTELDQMKAKKIFQSAGVSSLQMTQATEIINGGTMPPLPPQKKAFQKQLMPKPRINDKKVKDF